MTQILLERRTIEGDSPVEKVWRILAVSRVAPIGYLARIRGASTSNLKYKMSPIAYQYCEGKLKSTHNRELKVPET